MQALVLTGAGAVELQEVSVPRSDDAALIRVDQAGICGTDVKIIDGTIPAAYPLVLGHEMIGEIVEAAPGGGLGVGTRVLLNPGVFCGMCDLCRRDKRHLCRRGGLLGRDRDGVFSEYVSAGEEFLHVVPDGMDRDAEALLQVFGTVVHAQRTVSPFPGATAVVIGLGVTGLLHVQLLSARGVSVIGVTRSAWKRELAETLGAVASAAPADAQGLIDDMTYGKGADIVVESVGSEETLSQAIELAGHAAHIVVFGTATGGSQGLPYYQLYFKELTLHNPRAAGPGDYDTAIALASTDKIVLSPLVTARYRLDRADAALGAIGGANLKVVFDMAAGE